jgi:short-subunit dehydrogenase
MSAEDMVDASLVGFDRGKLVTIPSLHAQDEWDAFEAARKTLSGHLSSNVPAARYVSAR